MEADSIIEWNFSKEIPIPHDVPEFLLSGEEPYTAFKTLKDSAIFTSKRLIVRDIQSPTEKKVKIYSLPYSSIAVWSVDKAGKFLNGNGEIELWTKAGRITIKVAKGSDAQRINSLLASCIVNG